jgi:hypothetical protein
LISDDIKIIYTNYANNTLEPILPSVKKILNVEFDIEFNYKCNLIEYLICCKMNNVNTIILEEKKGNKIYVDCLKKIIQTGKYR